MYVCVYNIIYIYTHTRRNIISGHFWVQPYIIYLYKSYRADLISEASFWNGLLIRLGGAWGHRETIESNVLLTLKIWLADLNLTCREWSFRWPEIPLNLLAIPPKWTWTLPNRSLEDYFSLNNWWFSGSMSLCYLGRWCMPDSWAWTQVAFPSFSGTRLHPETIWKIRHAVRRWSQHEHQRIPRIPEDTRKNKI